jgi:hypothetical protein
MANLLHTKGSRTQIYKTLPSSSIGNDGDIILSQIQGRGVYLCSKVNGKWHVSNKMEELRKIEKTSIKDLKLDRVRLGNTTITKDEYDVSSGDFTLDVAGNIILEATTSINSDTPLKIKEAAAAVADTTAYGQLWVKTATPNELYFTTDAGNDIQLTSGTTTAFVGDITGVTAGTNCSGGGTSGAVTINVDDAFIKNDADDVMLGTLTIKSETADQLNVSYDANNYALLNVSATGDLEIETVGAGTTDSDITLNADGDIELNADGGQVTIKDGPASHFLFDCDSTKFRIFDDVNANDYFTISVGAEGATTISTVDADTTAAHLTLDVDGDITLDAGGTDIYLKANGTTFGLIDGGVGAGKSRIFLYEAGGQSTDDYFFIDTRANGETNITTVDTAGADAHILLNPDGDLNLTPATQVKSDAPLKIKEAADAVADTAAYGQLWVKTATPNELYFTTDAGDDIALTSGTSAAGGGGTSRWHQTLGGYKTNNNSTSNYYTIYRVGYDNWSNSDSSPTSLSNYDSYSTAFTAPADGTLTNITVVGQALDTGAADAFKFYVYKAVPPHNGTTATATLIGTTSAISTSATTRVFNVSTDISSSNTFSAGDSLYVWLKKDATSGNQDLYFSVAISGEYD